jgi:hypothetical protein
MQRGRREGREQQVHLLADQGQVLPLAGVEEDLGLLAEEHVDDRDDHSGQQH